MIAHIKYTVPYRTIKLEKTLSEIRFFPKILKENITVLRKGKIEETLTNNSSARIDNNPLSDFISTISHDSLLPKKLMIDNMTRL